MKTRSLRILITDAKQLSALGAIRSLGRAGHTVIAAYRKGLERPASLWSRYCSGSLCYPDPWYNHFEFRDWLRHQTNRGEFDAVLPVTEASVVGVASVRRECPKDCLLVLPSDSALEYTLSKFRATQMALSVGVVCPRTLFVSDGTSRWDWDCDFLSLQFPIMIKTDNYLTREGVYEKGRSFVAANVDKAAEVLQRLEPTQARIIAQELIPGSGVGAFLLRFNEATYLKFAHRRLHEVPYTGGWSSFRESCRDDTLIQSAETLLEAIGYDGAAMVEFRRGRRDGIPYFLEINGRLWVSLALALHCGIDFPKALIECYQNTCPKRQTPNYRPGMKCRNISSTLSIR